jgi:hypothetical protein
MIISSAKPSPAFSSLDIIPLGSICCVFVPRGVSESRPDKPRSVSWAKFLGLRTNPRISNIRKFDSYRVEWNRDFQIQIRTNTYI